MAVEPLMEADPVPYRTAQLSHSEFTYMIPVSIHGPKFIRLYFYSSTYENFDNSKAFFSVKAGQFNVLRNFSVFFNAEALGKKDIEKEFYILVQDLILNVTFTPRYSVLDSFAFVNGNEVVSTPADLYFMDPEDHGHILVGQKVEYPLRNDTTLETMYQTNIGGSFRLGLRHVSKMGRGRRLSKDTGSKSFANYHP
ncbi:hypothetical protein L484_018188 [Morus notabilis]|uniref:Malectin domain-containing protein n=1 Tax=Morus notabilis TaxID=981085 RepID=W9R9L2_9ROSA|nr:hypothetical protein L484_018188 [Morus notabilis]